jgi:hypothetical protein
LGALYALEGFWVFVVTCAADTDTEPVVIAVHGTGAGDYRNTVVVDGDESGFTFAYSTIPFLIGLSLTLSNFLADK